MIGLRPGSTLSRGERPCRMTAGREIEISAGSVASVGELGDRAGLQRDENPLFDLPERIAHAALRVLLAVLFFGRTGRDGQRTIHRLDDVGHRDVGRRPAELIPAASALVRRQQPLARKPLQHLRHQLDWNVVLLGNFARARRCLVGPQRQMLHRDERVISLLRQP